MEDYLPRLKQAFDYLKSIGKVHTQRGLAQDLNMSPGRVCDALKGKPLILTELFMSRFADTYADVINREWVLNGTGNMEMPKLTQKPHYPIGVAAGTLMTFNESVSMADVIHRDIVVGLPDYDFTVEVSGNSMAPVILPNDIVACRKVAEIQNIEFGKIYVVESKDGIVVKRIMSATRSRISVASENPNYKPYNIDINDGIKAYKVVGIISTDVDQRSEIYLTMVADAIRRAEAIRNV